MENHNLFLSRFFSTGRAIVVAFDHGMFDGPIPGLEHIRQIPQRILPDIDGVLMSPGILSDIGTKLCGHRNSPIPIVRINWSTIYCFQWDYHSGDTVKVLRPEEALRNGAQMVLISLSLQTGNQERDARNVETFCQLAQQAHNLGLPVIGEYFPVNDEKLSPKQMHEEIKIGCRILYELGADLIKTFYTEDFEKVVEGCPIPILSLGGSRLNSDLEALKFAQTQIKSGSSGIVFGRNVIQSDKPLEMQKALIEIVKKEQSPEEMARKYELS